MNTAAKYVGIVFDSNENLQAVRPITPDCKFFYFNNVQALLEHFLEIGSWPDHLSIGVYTVEDNHAKMQATVVITSVRSGLTNFICNVYAGEDGLRLTADTTIGRGCVTEMLFTWECDNGLEFIGHKPSSPLTKDDDEYESAKRYVWVGEETEYTFEELLINATLNRKTDVALCRTLNHREFVVKVMHGGSLKETDHFVHWFCVISYEYSTSEKQTWFAVEKSDLLSTASVQATFYTATSMLQQTQDPVTIHLTFAALIGSLPERSLTTMAFEVPITVNQPVTVISNHRSSCPPNTVLLGSIETYVTETKKGEILSVFREFTPVSKPDSLPKIVRFFGTEKGPATLRRFIQIPRKPNGELWTVESLTLEAFINASIEGVLHTSFGARVVAGDAPTKQVSCDISTVEKTAETLLSSQLSIWPIMGVVEVMINAALSAELGHSHANQKTQWRDFSVDADNIMTVDYCVKDDNP